nr:MAG TPA: hypothetical protein [Caudoviricetes sp.]
MHRSSSRNSALCTIGNNAQTFAADFVQLFLR